MREPVVQRVTVTQRSRPLRFAFLLEGWEDSCRLRSAIRLFTSLWGGRYNCLVPIQLDPPPWTRGRRSGIEIAEGYLGAFEPDFLVTDNLGLTEGLSYEDDRVLVMSELSGQHADTPFSHGIGVDELYRWMWNDDFQYEKRDPPEVVLPRAVEVEHELLVATCFGEFGKFPGQNARGPDFEGIFRHVFGASDLDVTADELLRLHLKGVGYPLSAGAHHLETWQRDPVLFVLDPASILDLVDFWNLRALGMNPVPVPVPWLDELTPQLAELAKALHRPHPHNPGYVLSAEMICGRSLEAAEVRAHEERLRAKSAPGALLLKRYPRVWHPWSRAHEDARRMNIAASRAVTDEVVLTGDRISFEACPLPLRTSRSPYRKADSARVVRVRSYLDGSSIASVTPSELRSAGPVIAYPSLHPAWFSSEGIVVTANGTNRFFWKVPRGTEVCRSWLSQHGFKLEVTSGGKLMHEAMQRLGGLDNTRILTREKLARLLNRMAGRPDRPPKTYPWQALVGKSAEPKNKNDRRLAELSVQVLVERKALEVGATLDCAHCGQDNWYGLDQLGTSLECDRCLQDFDFPATKPPPKPWRYRTVGPFAVENYIQGGLSVLLSMRLLASTSAGARGDGITWCPSFTLKRNDGSWGEVEVDAMAFIEQIEPYAGSVFPVFVEGKSYGKKHGGSIFEEKDIFTMRRIGERFPGAVLVFATLSSSLKQADVDSIKPLAKEGRQPIADGHWQNAVVVLTGRELFSEFGPPECWETLDESEAFAKMSSAAWSLHRLADATQQLYLGMEPYSGRWIGNSNPSPPGSV